MGDLNICPNCPYVSFIPLIKAEQVSYTRQKEELTAHETLSENASFSFETALGVSNLQVFSHVGNNGALCPCRSARVSFGRG